MALLNISSKISIILYIIVFFVLIIVIYVVVDLFDKHKMLVIYRSLSDHCDPYTAYKNLLLIHNYYKTGTSKYSFSKKITLDLHIVSTLLFMNNSELAETWNEGVYLKYKEWFSKDQETSYLFYKFTLAMNENNDDEINRLLPLIEVNIEGVALISHRYHYMCVLKRKLISRSYMKNEVNDLHQWLEAYNSKTNLDKVTKAWILGNVYYRQNKNDLAIEKLEYVIRRGNKLSLVEESKSLIETLKSPNN